VPNRHQLFLSWLLLVTVCVWSVTVKVEALKGCQVIDVACGSGDAQTLCVTDDGDVWSWGDGDYGKLGRGGSDGCKVPIRIESLHGMAVVKVECGSQFSVALTKSGAVYTWQVLISVILLTLIHLVLYLLQTKRFRDGA